MSRFLATFAILSIASSAAAQLPQEPLVKQVKIGIARGVANLVARQQGNGAWEELAGDEKSVYRGGTSALIVLALIQCDGVLDDPKLEQRRLHAVKIGLEHIRAIDSGKVYVRALQTMALADARNPKDLKQLDNNVQWLLDARVYKANKFIGWGYDQRHITQASDASNSQYAMLALWHARQAGAKIPRNVWEEIRDYYTRTQTKDGAWIYSNDYGPDDEKGASVTMSVAGLCGLLIAGMELNGGREQWLSPGRFQGCGSYSENEPLAKALAWVSRDKNFSLTLSGRSYYHLYGIERAGRLSGQRFFGAHDWYREGCEFLVKRQESDGSWQKLAGWDRWPNINTAFALLFLSKGRTPVVISKLVHGNWPRREDDTDWNNDRNDLRFLTDYLSRSELFDRKPLAWQTYDIQRSIEARLDKNAVLNIDEEDAVLSDMRQSPILYFNGHTSPLRRFQDVEIKLIKRFTENGGFLVAEACCGDPRFDEGVKEWVKDVWPGSELRYLDSTHPIWTSYHTITGGEPYKLMGLQVGCRTVMIYSPQDLSCWWESNKYEGDARGVLAFRLGANIVAYGTGRVAPQPRLTPIDIASATSVKEPPRKRGFFEIRQIYHQGDWQPAPRAMQNVLLHVHKTAGLDVRLQVQRVLPTDSDIASAKFLYMHGRQTFTINKGGLDHLRLTLDNGGLLLADACCGSPEFDKAFRTFAANLFPGEKLVTVSNDLDNPDPLFSATLNDEALTASNIKCRTKVNGSMQPMAPQIEGIKRNGRWVVLYSKYDLGCALEKHASPDCVGYDPDSALRIATAAVRYNVRP